MANEQHLPQQMEGKPDRTMATVWQAHTTIWATDMMRNLLARGACGMTTTKAKPKSCGEGSDLFLSSKPSNFKPQDGRIEVCHCVDVLAPAIKSFWGNILERDPNDDTFWRSLLITAQLLAFSAAPAGFGAKIIKPSP
jgi:hypothetical protein